MSLHVYPVGDEREHETCGLTCWCEPDVQFHDPETGEPYSEPLVIHHAADCREVVEEAERIKMIASDQLNSASRGHSITIRLRPRWKRILRFPIVLLQQLRVTPNPKLAFRLAIATTKRSEREHTARDILMVPVTFVKLWWTVHRCKPALAWQISMWMFRNMRNVR